MVLVLEGVADVARVVLEETVMAARLELGFTRGDVH